MKKYLIGFVVLLVLLVGGAVIGPSFVDWSKYKNQIVTQVGQATGHEITIAGGLEFAVLPFPRLKIQELDVKNPDAPQGQQQVVSIKEAAVSVALMPLLQKEIIVDRVELIDPVITVNVANDGSMSWQTNLLKQKMEQGQANKEGGNALLESVSLNEVRIKNGKFSYSDSRSGQNFVVEQVNTSVKGDSVLGPYTVDGDLRYMNQKIKLGLNAGRLDKLKESLKLSGKAEFPDLAALVEYSGVVSVDKAVQAQGEAAVTAANLKAFMEAFGAKSSDYMARKTSVRGLLTYSGDELAYKNMAVTFGDLAATGSFSAMRLKERNPVVINANLDTTKPLVVDALMPPKDPAAKKAFIPETFNLPMDVSLTLIVNAKTLQYKGSSFTDAAISFDKQGKEIKAQFKGMGPGNSDIALDSKLEFASATISEQNKSVTYSDPKADYTLNLKSQETIALLKTFVKEEQLAGAKNILSDSVQLASKGSVSPKKVTFDSVQLTMLATRLDMAGSYTLGSPRDKLTLTVQNQTADLDKWAAKMKGKPATPATQQPVSKEALLGNIAKALALPFDAAVTVTADTLRYQGLEYSKLIAKGDVTGNKMTIDSLSITDPASNSFVMAGNIGDVAAMKQIDLSVEAKTEDLEKLLQNYKVDTSNLPRNVGRADIVSEMKGDAEKLSFTTNVNAMRGSLEASGNVASILKTPVLSALTFRLRHPSYVDLIRIFSPSFSSGVTMKKALDVYTSMEREGNVYKFNQLKAQIGEALISGSVAANVSGSKPVVVATLDLGDFPLDAFIGAAKSGKGSTIQANPIRKPEDVRWSRNAINTDWMHMLDLDLKATANSFTYGGWQLYKAGINMALKSGTLDITQLDGELFGGQAALTGQLKSSGKERQPLSVQSNVLLQNVALEGFVKAFSGSQLVRAQGDISLEGNIAATGLSPAALVFDLHGTGKGNGTNLVFEGFDLARLSRAIAAPSSSGTQNFTSLMSATMGGAGTTKFDTLESVFDIKEGVIHLTKLDLVGPAADVVSTGLVSLPLWTIDMTSTVNLKDPADAPPLKVTFKGPLDRPSQTFGQSAMQMFFQKQLEGLLLNPLIEKMGGKTEKVLPGALGDVLKPLTGGMLQQPQQQQPQAQPQAQPQQQAPVQEQQPQQQQQQPVQQQRPATPEEAFFGILQNVIEKSQ